MPDGAISYKSIALATVRITRPFYRKTLVIGCPDVIYKHTVCVHFHIVGHKELDAVYLYSCFIRIWLIQSQSQMGAASAPSLDNNAHMLNWIGV